MKAIIEYFIQEKKIGEIRQNEQRWIKSQQIKCENAEELLSHLIDKLQDLICDIEMIEDRN